MYNTGINTFYDQYINGEFSEKNNFSGHFDFLLWEDLQKDLSACGRFQRKPFYKMALLQGEAVYHSGHQQIHISGKTIVFTDPMIRFSFEATDKNFDGKYCVCSESFLRGTSKLSLGNWPVFKDRNIYTQSLTDEQYTELLRIFKEIEQEYKSDYPFKEELIRNKVFDVVHFTQKLNKNLIESIQIKDESLEDRFFKLLENAFFNISKEMPLEDKSPAYFAELLFTSVDQLNKTIKKVSGKTTQTHIHERIIEEANVLLKHTIYSVKEIAWSLHFQETSHFQNFYKKQTNRTPLEYRAG
ncbi:AraC-like DNA-binding protein [Pedobacter cryoconitis]|uniref:AraC-like DNA-binding protein n=1 Tax=Pedobacter cryoconitis TaxID=188932 RepID=A0A7W8ZJN4_9SPHI|nr:AraC family transcriptional regulator [Pedobacter cryoconitis]MBB5635023.1 AraC-like DNA-binding protein [Pedobacter cryoconitis]MBB6271793.1 AraC-like DNA-binding protein [Pedobacter cryoconitis]